MTILLAQFKFKAQTCTDNHQPYLIKQGTLSKKAKCSLLHIPISQCMYVSKHRDSVEISCIMSEETRYLHMNAKFYFSFSCKSQRAFNDVVLAQILITHRSYAEAARMESYKRMLYYKFFVLFGQLQNLRYNVYFIQTNDFFQDKQYFLHKQGFLAVPLLQHLHK